MSELRVSQVNVEGIGLCGHRIRGDVACGAGNCLLAQDSSSGEVCGAPNSSDALSPESDAVSGKRLVGAVEVKLQGVPGLELEGDS